MVWDATLDGREVAQEDLGERVDLGLVSGAPSDVDGSAISGFDTVSSSFWMGPAGNRKNSLVDFTIADLIMPSPRKGCAAVLEAAGERIELASWSKQSDFTTGIEKKLTTLETESETGECTPCHCRFHIADRRYVHGRHCHGKPDFRSH